MLEIKEGVSHLPFSHLFPASFLLFWVTRPNPTDYASPQTMHFCQQVHCWLRQMEALGEPGGWKEGRGRSGPALQLRWDLLYHHLLPLSFQTQAPILPNLCVAWLAFPLFLNLGA